MQREAEEAAAAAEAMGGGNPLASLMMPPAALGRREGPPVVGLRDLPKTQPVGEVVRAMREVRVGKVVRAMREVRATLWMGWVDTWGQGQMYIAVSHTDFTLHLHPSTQVTRDGRPLPPSSYRFAFPVLSAVLSSPAHTPLHDEALAVVALHCSATLGDDIPRRCDGVRSKPYGLSTPPLCKRVGDMSQKFACAYKTPQCP